MSFLGNQLASMMVNKIKVNNPKLTPYLDEIQNGGNTTEILEKAIKNNVISKTQWNQAKPLLAKYGKQMGVSVSQEDIEKLDKAFNKPTININTNSGFKF